MTFEEAVNDAANMARGGDMRFCAAMLRALEALAAERAEARRAPAWEEKLREQSTRFKAHGNPPFRLALGKRGYCVARDAECRPGCFEAGGGCLAEAAAIQAQARGAEADAIRVEYIAPMKAPEWPIEARSMDDAFEIMQRRPGFTEANNRDAATVRVAIARANAPEPRSISHWGMFA